MTVGQRIKLILNEQKIKQTDFAKALGVSSNYINLIVNDKKHTISDTLARLIEEIYGYSSQWILHGTCDKFSQNNLTIQKTELTKKIQKMSGNNIKTVLALVNTLEDISNKEED